MTLNHALIGIGILGVALIVVISFTYYMLSYDRPVRTIPAIVPLSIVLLIFSVCLGIIIGFKSDADIKITGNTPMPIVKSENSLFSTFIYFEKDGEMQEKNLFNVSFIKGDVEQGALYEGTAKWGPIEEDKFIYVYPKDETKMTSDEQIFVKHKEESILY